MKPPKYYAEILVERFLRCGFYYVGNASPEAEAASVIAMAMEHTRDVCARVAFDHASDNTDDNPGYSAALEIAHDIQAVEVPK